jgi:hypothetical protein
MKNSEFHALKLSDGSLYYLSKLEFDKANKYIWHKGAAEPYRNKNSGDMEYLCDFIDRYCFDRRIVKNLLSKRPIFNRGRERKRY